MAERDLAQEAAAAIPITVLTGFLGSGKTTVLNYLVHHPGMAETVVLINEFGAVALDHLLVERIDEETVVLNSGCLCCTVRGDLVDALKTLFLRRVRGEIPEFRRLMIETTGLADPAPVIHTLISDLLIAARYRLDGIITCVDAVNGSIQLDEHQEAVKQAAMADRLLITKTDLARDPAVLRDRLRRLNPAAPKLTVINGEVDPAAILDVGLFDGKSKTPDVERWLNEAAFEAAGPAHAHDHSHGHDVNRHDDHIAAFCLVFATPLRWDRFANAMEMLLTTQGTRLLRIKGILAIEEAEQPVAVHGVQHVFHPPVPLPAWPDADRRSRLVFITRDLGAVAIADLIRGLTGVDCEIKTG